MNTKKSNGLDGVNGRVLQDATPAVAGPLTAIMNAPLFSGIIPNEWKLSKVTVIHKDGPQTDPSNYRMVTLKNRGLSVPSSLDSEVNILH